MDRLSRPVESCADPCPDLPIERGPRDEGVGSWVPEEKHRYLREYLIGTRYAWAKWPSRVFIDPFAGPGRVQVRGESVTHDGGAVVAWRALYGSPAAFTRMLVGDLSAERADACGRRLRALGAPTTSFFGPADQTISSMVAAVPRNSLCMAYVDPYNLELLSYELLKELARLPRVDLAVNFCTMDLKRNGDLEFDPDRARFDAAAPGWREKDVFRNCSKSSMPVEFFAYWCDLVKRLGFSTSKEMPLVRNDQGHPIYRMVFFARHDLPTRVWSDVAKSRNRSFDF